MEHPFQHCSACGAGGPEPRSGRELVCRTCGYRHFVTPIPAACVILHDSTGRLLVIRRAHEPGLGRLGVPGGVIEGGETAEQACARELREETGLVVAAEEFRYFTSLPNQYLFQGFVWPTIDLFYSARVESFDAAVPDAAEVSQWMALPADKVPLEDFAFGSNAEAVRRWRMGVPF